MLSGFESDDEDDEEIEAGDNRLRTDAWRNSNETNPMPTTHALDGPSSTPSKGDTRQATRNDRRTCRERQTRTSSFPTRRTDRQPANDLDGAVGDPPAIWAHLNEKAPRVKQGILPRRLPKCRVATCSACLYRKATKRPLRNKPKKSGDNNSTWH